MGRPGGPTEDEAVSSSELSGGPVKSTFPMSGSGPVLHWNPCPSIFIRSGLGSTVPDSQVTDNDTTFSWSAVTFPFQPSNRKMHLESVYF